MSVPLPSKKMPANEFYLMDSAKKILHFQKAFPKEEESTYATMLRSYARLRSYMVWDAEKVVPLHFQTCHIVCDIYHKILDETRAGVLGAPKILEAVIYSMLHHHYEWDTATTLAIDMYNNILNLIQDPSLPSEYHAACMCKAYFQYEDIFANQHAEENIPGPAFKFLADTFTQLLSNSTGIDDPVDIIFGYLELRRATAIFDKRIKGDK